MLLILSARPVDDDIALQFGRLPPSFLPLGARRLFSLQAEAARGGPCAMTLPAGFEISPIDREALEAAGVALVTQPEGMRLTEAIGHALTQVRPQGPLRLLYGDTLVRMSAAAGAHADMVAVQDTTANYAWAFVETRAEGGVRFSDAPPDRLDSRRVVCGYYHFSDPDLLAAACHERTIVDALNVYNERQPLLCEPAEDWMDFGHLPLYFQSKKSVMVKRAFNDLVYEDHRLIKRSDDTLKMRAEAHWFENLPPSLQLHAPRYGGRVERDHRAGYAVEYLYHPLLADLFALGALPLASWLEIVSACFEVVEKLHALRPPPGSPEASPAYADRFFHHVVVDKTWSRIERHCAGGGCGLDDVYEIDGRVHPPLREVIAELIARVPPTRPEDVRFWHGDLFFGNMFYDFTARRALCIDPRGQLEAGEFSLWGDRRYDLAKLAHSILGQYDKIVLGRSRLVEEGPRRWRLRVDAQPHQAKLEAIFTRFVRESCGVGMGELLALTALLFISMLPLHADRPDLQRQFLATGLALAARAREAEA